jgi:hypothetical protein
LLDPEGVTHATCALSTLRNCSSVTLDGTPDGTLLGEFVVADGAEFKDAVVDEECVATAGTGARGSRCPATPARNPATTKTVMLMAG